MHRALQTFDILHEIFQHLTPSLHADELCSETSHTLYNSALVCKAMSHHALDALWSVVHDLDPLSNLLPGASVFDMGQLGYGLGYETFLTMPLCREDLTPFERYSHRIKAYHSVDDEDHHTIFRVAPILQICHLLGRQHLFPNLRLLSICRMADSYYYFISPNLRILRVGYLVGERERTSLLNHLYWTTPRLEHLEIMDDCADTAFMLSYIARLRELRTLKYPARIRFTVTSPEHNSFFDNLFHLEVHSIEITPHQANTNIRTIPQYRQLRRLILTWATITHIAYMVVHSPFHSLEYLQITFITPPNSPDDTSAYTQLFTALFHRPSPLKRIVLKGPHSGPVKYQVRLRELLQNAVLQQQLEDFQIRFALLTPLSLNSLEMLSAIFPNIARLALPKSTVSRRVYNRIHELFTQLEDVEINVQERRKRSN